MKKNKVRPVKDKNRTMRLNQFLANKYMMTITIIVIDIILFSLINYILNSIYALPEWIRDIDHPSTYIGIKNVLPHLKNTSNVYTGVQIASWIFVVLYDVIFIFRVRTAYAAENFNVGQKGDSRWTTLKEIQEQYKEIPEKDKKYPGMPGIIISRWKDKIYIDDSVVNNLIIGITRSGKGEMFVFPSIDVYSRAEIQPSMIICDPKVELFKSSKKILEERGYEVHLLNLADPIHSMGFNPLTEIIETYKQKDYATAELLAQSFAYSVFNPDESKGDSQFFDSTAAQLLTALIIAHIEDCLGEDRRNAYKLKKWEEKREAFDALESQEEKEIARRSYQLYKREGIDVINDKRIDYIPPEEKIGPFKNHEEDINMYSIINTFTELGRMKTEDGSVSMLDLYFSERPALDRAKLKYASIEIAGYRTKASVYANMLAKMTIFTYQNIAKMTAESSIQLKDIGFGKKPMAIFLGIPDYDRSNHFLASVFIRQVYFVLAKMCIQTMKCERPVKFICDEFGNIPAIESMANIITVCLGRNISFDLYIQSYAQLNKLYEEDADTIIGNCSNQIYILAEDEKTADKFSKLVGNETVIDLQRMGKKLAIGKNFTESNIEKPLLNVNQLLNLKEGECVVVRATKRKDLEGKKIVSNPIFNSAEFNTAFKYRYEYLLDSFPNPNEILLSEVNSEDRSFVNERNKMWDYALTFRQFRENNTNEIINGKTMRDVNPQIYSALKQSIIKMLGENSEILINMDDMSMDEFESSIQESMLKEDDKKAILSVIKNER
ncbi:type IV secretory system conjugative DNA transfer family protein [Dorea longicatena]|uniref:type IV secretory system conjugative DNA transfer family protein n=1 Tax=Dorea longicatena TaxID=88431 RepID=UPI00156E81AF|nr:type IV secretory system conjugative DNA transfer family protein [Dorea longicatena]NSD68950.1 type IV secretory system conjugative DNA transfer family protein [Dorea longicatena]